jgi:hypothetical protein
MYDHDHEAEHDTSHAADEATAPVEKYSVHAE